MKRITATLCIAAAVLLGTATAYRFVQRKLPPYEMGDHGGIVLAAQQPAGPSTGPQIGGCPVFPADNVWNTPIDQLPVDSHSAAYIDVMRPINRLHPDFGTDPTAGIPFTMVPADTRRVPVEFEYHDDSDLAEYPIPPDAPVEGGPHPKDDGDRHVILIEKQRCRLYELFAAKKQANGSWKAGSGIIMDLTSNSLRPEGKTSADAAGLPILPGLVRYEEVSSGEIRHALRFTTTRTQSAYVWPARHFASPHHEANFPPMGKRFRLRADFDIAGYPREDQVILTALKKYGMILADNGGDMYISGVPDKRWNDDDLHKLSQVRASDFEAVDESSLQMTKDSGRVDPLAGK